MQQKRPVTVEDLYEYCWLSDPSLCPVTGTITYVQKTIDKKKNDYHSHIRVITHNQQESKPLTQGKKDFSPAWSPDGSMLAFLRMTDQGRQVWVLPAHGGEATQLTYAKRGVGMFVWSPDGRCIAYTTRTSVDKGREARSVEEDKKSQNDRARIITRTAFKSEGSGLWDGLHSHVFVIDVQGGNLTQITEGEFDASQPCWSPDGGKLAFLAKMNQGEKQDPDLMTYNDIYLAGREGGEWTKLTNSTLMIHQVVFSPNGRTIAFTGNNRLYGSATQNEIFTLTMEDGKVDCLSGTWDAQFGNFSLSDMKPAVVSPSPVFSPDGAELYTLVSQYGNVHVYKFSMDGSRQAVTSGDRDIYQFVLSSDGRYLVMASTNAANPGDLYRVDLRTLEEVRLTHSNDGFMEQVTISSPEPFWFEAADGREVQGWVIKPTGSVEGKKYPAILHIHGGPHAMYANAYSHEFQMLASHGYAVIYTNPRGSFGYGQTFVKACRGDFGGADYGDLMSAIDFVIDAYDFVDGSRLGVTGGSYGGFMTNWMVGHTNRFQAAVTHRSISNWLSFYGTCDIGISYTEGEIEGTPWDDPDKLWKRSPLAYVKEIETPLLILHSEQDLRCPIEQAEQLFVALRRLGKTTKFVRFPNSNHALLKSGKPSLRVESLQHLVNWFDDHIAGGNEK
ncbi:S9 family peptidase [Paenibacillus hemerocallicola]|uniref:S9 family peptidase n=1 Tax=Paenibacillus hemerocallicola TaxID=1172614 RepID=A0A5C4T3K0_9BACL|nr:S9 family peptidase [Paenibacillus hemerocallicola]TNJ63613.1 S9 family peptidase [Paenibacillus hemerocallicola]